MDNNEELLLTPTVATKGDDDDRADDWLTPHEVGAMANPPRSGQAVRLWITAGCRRVAGPPVGGDSFAGRTRCTISKIASGTWAVVVAEHSPAVYVETLPPEFLRLIDTAAGDATRSRYPHGGCDARRGPIGDSCMDRVGRPADRAISIRKKRR